ncbi:hypothetical protein DRP04_10590 [Archaeoglobales archaeon]|nr:MAG: hypothetical protein DRP04_10590 [Archaeoglobales archaeon]
MAIYSRKFTVPPDTEREFSISLDGDVITYVRIRYPPGPCGLLRIAFFYGPKQIFPYEEETWFYGDDEIIEWQEYYEVPERPMPLTIKAINDDDTYEHSFYVVINVQDKKYLLAQQLANSIARALRRLLGFV